MEVFAVLKRFTCGTCVLLYSTRCQWIIPVNDFQMFHTAPLLQYHLIQYDVTSLCDEPQDMIEHVIIEIIAHKSTCNHAPTTTITCRIPASHLAALDE